MNNQFRIPQVSVLWTDTVRVEASWKSGRCNFFREKKRLNRRSDRKNFHIIETGSMGLAVERCWWFFVFTTNTKAVTRFLSPLPHFVIFCWSWVNDLQVIRVFSARKANYLVSISSNVLSFKSWKLWSTSRTILLIFGKHESCASCRFDQRSLNNVYKTSCRFSVGFFYSFFRIKVH